MDEGREHADVLYSSQTARDQNCGPANRRNEYAYHQRNSETDWEYVDGTWRVRKIPRPEEAVVINGETQTLGFGEFAGWTYVGVLTYKPTYIEFLLDDIDGDEIPEKKRYVERIRCNNVATAADDQTGSAGCKEMRRTFLPSNVINGWVIFISPSGSPAQTLFL